MTEKPNRPTLVSSQDPPASNPFPPETPRPGQTTTPNPANVVRAMRGGWLARDVKEAIIDGAAAYGSDGTGTGGMPGYLQMCAAQFPKEYMGLLARLVPLQHRDATARNPAINIGSVNIHPVASDRYLTATEMREMATPIIENPPQANESQAEPELDFGTPGDPRDPPETPRDTPEDPPVPIDEPPPDAA